MAAPLKHALDPLAPFLTLLLLLFGALPALADTPYENKAIANEAGRFDALLRDQHRTVSKNANRLIIEGTAFASSGDQRAAIRAYGAAYVAGGGPRALLLLSNTLLNVKPKDYRERYTLPEQASAAAYLAYTRSSGDNAKADALVFLARALEKRKRWRETLEALRASLSLDDRRSVRDTYEALYKQHGFRITDYKVDSDSAAPRLCITFSEKLNAGAEYDRYVTVAGMNRPAVSVSGQQLCVEGLRHGERYNLKLREGLPAAIDDRLRKSADLTVYVKDRTPTVRLSSKKYVLPRIGQSGIPIVSVNTDKVYVRIFRVGERALSNAVQGDFLDQLSGYNISELKNRLGQEIWKGTLDVSSKLNEDVTTAFPVTNAIPDMQAGVYVLIADAKQNNDDDWRPKATQWFVVSDLGVASLSDEDGVNVFVRSLTSAAPVAGITVKLIAKNNEILGTGQTDGGGFINFPAGLARGEGGMTPALITAEGKHGDYAFLDLTAPAFDLSDRGVAGRATPGPVDVMLYTERGVYKPGETVHLTGLARDQNAIALENLPLTIKFLRPDGLEYRRTVTKDEGLGGRSFSLTLDPGVATGTWRALAYVDVKQKPVGETAFLVEDFVPERMDMALKPAQKTLKPGGRMDIDVAANYLYGAPAADNALEGELEIRARKSAIDGFKDYRFGLASDKVETTRHTYGDLPRTDAKGNAQIHAELPELPETTRPLEADMTVRLRDPSGRAIERRVVFPILPAEPVIGIKPLFDGLKEGDTAEFDVAVMGTNGKQAAFRGLTWELVKLNTRYQWYSRDGNWNYEPITTEQRIATGRIDTKADAPVRLAAPVDWGRYRLEVRADNTGRPAASYAFYAGWYASALSDSPDMLDVGLDKTDYRIGETAKLRISSRMAGKALITVLNNGIRAMKTVDVPKGDSTTQLTVDESWGAGAYVAVNLYRPMDVADKRMPGRAIGLKWLSAGREKHVLDIVLQAPDKIRPEGALDIPVSIAGLEAGADAYVVAAAVDVGILNLTHYKAPAPENWFLAQRKLSGEFRDVYGKLIDGMGAVAGKIRSGGDGAGLSMAGNPPDEKPVSLYSGIVKVGTDGKAMLHFDVPAFNGTLKVMLVAWSRDRMGHAVSNVIVRDPVILMGTAPRFLKVGDKSLLHLVLHNVEGPAGAYRLAIGTGSPGDTITTPQTLDLKLAADERHNLDIPLAPTGIGKAVVTAALSGPNGLALGRSYTIPVEPAYPNVTRQSVQTVASGARLILTKDVFTGLVPGTEKATLSVGPASLPDVPGLLTSLDRYPYGCSEQITSVALPLLYLSSVAREAGIEQAKADDIKDRVQKAINTLVSRQGFDGGIGLWSPGSDGIWLTSYVGEFLTRAREKGYTVPMRNMTLLLDRLSNTVGYASDFKKGGEDIAYALYVLARNKRARLGDLRYYADEKLDNFATPMAKAQLATALAFYGDEVRAKRAFQSAVNDLSPASPAKVERRIGSDYGSQLRDGAATLALASETRLASSIVPEVIGVVDADRTATDTISTSTQEKAWLLLAANALFDEAKSYRLDVDGVAHSGALSRIMTLATLQSPLDVTNKGDAKARAVVTVSGSPKEPEPARTQGFTIERAYYTLSGEKVDVSNVTQNTRLVTVLTVQEGRPLGGPGKVSDPLPAGFEIDNPHLVSSADISSLSWLPKSETPKHTEFRDDRFLAAFDLTIGRAKTLTMAYVVRAVAPGRYVHGPASVEDMYRPERVASTNAGFVDVTRGK